jgi:hypothetical protein
MAEKWLNRFYSEFYKENNVLYSRKYGNKPIQLKKTTQPTKKLK